MTSILTNAAATTALQTLRTVGNNLTHSQSEVSSGLRVRTASDNAAYWSVATTMRSDKGAVSAVSDALWLGAAKVDTAYQGTEAIIDVLDKFKSKLVTAKESSVDKGKVQTELDQLNEQAESIVASSSFNGTNWLTTSQSTRLESGNLQDSVVASFVRSGDGVSVQTTVLDLKSTSMLNTGGGGILQKDAVSEMGNLGGLANANLVASAHNGHETHQFTGPATFGATDYIDFSVVVDADAADPNVPATAARADAGVTYNLHMDKSTIDAALGTTNGTISTPAQMRTVLQKVFDDSGVPLWTVPPAGYTSFSSPSDSSLFEIGSLEISGHKGSSIDIVSGSVTSQISGHAAGFALGLEDAPKSNHDNMYPKATMSFSSAFTVSGDNKVYFDVQIDGSASQRVTIDQSTIDTALGSTDGYVGNVDDFATVLAYATSGTGITATSNDSQYPGQVTFFADPAIYPRAGLHAARFNITNVRADPPLPVVVPFDLDEVDVTGSDFTVDDYIQGVDLMLEKATTSASNLGSLQQRIDMQTDFASKLTDSISSGISRLVDANMESESARLSALQTQQQLSVNSLSIANQQPQAILSLFSH